MTWPLTVDDYKAWARIHDTLDDPAIADAVAAVVSAVELRCTLVFVPPTEPPVAPVVPADITYGSLLWVNRLLDRRNSPTGSIGIPEAGVAQLRTTDPDIARLLSPYTEPVLGVNTLEAAVVIVAKLEAEGVRATTDVSAMAPPVILVTPPGMAFDLNCGATLTWTLLAVAPAPQGPDRVSWELLTELIDAAAACFPLETATPVVFSRVGTSVTLPAYELKWKEALS